MTLLACATLAAMAASDPALGARQVYEYRVVHERYGDIGTYTNIVEQQGDETRVKSELHVAVRILGIVVFRQEAQRSEYWRQNRFISFDGSTVTNGDKVEIRGRARDGGFAVTTPSGTVMAPAEIHPSNPWCPMVLNAPVMMSTKTGKVTKVRVTIGQKQSVSFNGNTLRAQQYDIFSDKHQVVWFDDRGVPVAFRTTEDDNGSAIDFVLVGPS